MLVDQYRRVHDYLRISLTDNCNLRCTYCMPADKNDFSPPHRLMQTKELIGIASIFTGLGVKKIRLTGGEPLVRKDAHEIIEGLSSLPVELTISTNGILADSYLDTFLKAGIRSVNISLDSLDADKFFQISRRNYFDKVWANILLMMKHDFHIKLNMVVMRGVNENEISDFVSLTRSMPLHVRFIEFMPFTGNHWDKTKVFTHQEILDMLSDEFDIIKLKDGKNDTTKKYKVIGHEGTFALISTMTAPFCGSCNRLRLTADGRMKNCLFSNGEDDLLEAYRRGEDIEQIIRQNIFSKKPERGGQFGELNNLHHPEEIHNRSMISIGG